MKPYLHIVSFNIPLPANYGGVIDVFYKIKALHQQGVEIILHCFVYDRMQHSDLEIYCKKVYYYQRKRGITHLFKPEPFIVSTRKNHELLKNLAADNYPILFEGIHCSGFINHPLLKFKKKLIRIHNVEYQYYQLLAKEETSIFKKLYFQLEAYKLKVFENNLQNAQHLLVLSNYDMYYYKQLYSSVLLIPPFHQYNTLNIEEKVGDYLLYNADFNISFNYKFAIELSLWSKKANIKLVLAGKVDFKPAAELAIVQNPTNQELDHLVANAFVNLISIEHPSGFKLKLVHALFRSKHIVVVGQFLEEFNQLVCPQLKHIQSLKKLDNSIQEIKKEQTPISQILAQRLISIQYFSNQQQAKQIISLL